MGTKWRQREIEAEKQKLKQMVAEKYSSGASHDDVLEFLLSGALPQDERENNIGIFNFVRVVRTLIQHKDHGGLSDAQLTKLFKYAVQILRAASVQPQDSQLAYLYGEVSIVKSQIERQQGEHWSALWSACQASLHMTDQYPGGIEFRELTLATRQIRLGNCHGAADRLRKVLPVMQMGSDLWFNAQLNLIKCLRLMKAFELAKLELGKLRACEAFQVDSSFGLESRWEEQIIESQSSKNFDALLPLAMSKQTIPTHSYLVEAHYWQRIIPSKIASSRNLPKLSYLLRREQAALRKLGCFFDVALNLERVSNDKDLPLSTVMSEVGECVALARKMVSVDKELLCLAACAAVMKDVSSELSNHIHWEYEQLSLRISDGTDRDALQVLSN